MASVRNPIDNLISKPNPESMDLIWANSLGNVRATGGVAINCLWDIEDFSEIRWSSSHRYLPMSRQLHYYALETCNSL
jgi:hypothetical protein